MLTSSHLPERRPLSNRKDSRIEAARLPGYAENASGQARTTFKVADNHSERADAFRLVYGIYVQAGLMRPNVFQMRVTPHQLLPTTAIFVAVRGSQVVATVSLVRDGELGLPLERVYGREVDGLRRPRTWLGEVSALASAPDAGESSFEVVVGLMRIMAQFARRHRIKHLLIAVHPRHARLYRRTMGFQTVGEARAYPSVCNRPAVALHLDLSWSDDSPPLSHQNYRLFFGESIADEHLQFCPMSLAESYYFAPALVKEPNLADAATPGAMLACA